MSSTYIRGGIFCIHKIVFFQVMGMGSTTSHFIVLAFALLGFDPPKTKQSGYKAWG